MRSFSIITASAVTTLFAFLPWMLSELFATMNPRERALWSMTVVGVDCLWYGAVLWPNGRTSLWFHAGRVGEDGDVVDPAVHRPALDAHDVRDGHALVGRRRREVERRARRVVGGELAR